MSESLSTKDKLYLILQAGWRECCLYDDLYSPPQSVPYELIRKPGEDQRMVWSIAEAYEIQTTILA